MKELPRRISETYNLIYVTEGFVSFNKVWEECQNRANYILPIHEVYEEWFQARLMVEGNINDLSDTGTVNLKFSDLFQMLQIRSTPPLL